MTDIVRLVTFGNPGSLYVRNSSTPLGVEGVIVDIWRTVAEELHLAYEVNILPQDVVVQQNVIPWAKMSAHLEDGSADVVLHHITPSMRDVSVQ